MNVETSLVNNQMTITRERKLTKAEKKADPSGKWMVDVVNITFGDGPPVIVVNSDVCS